MRPVGAATLLVALALAGCSGAVEEPTTDPATTPSLTTTADVTVDPVVPPPRDPATLVDGERTGHEPTVVVTRNGTVLVHARGVEGRLAEGDPVSVNRVWRSVDGGATFTRAGTPEMEDPLASEGTIALLDSGRVLAAFSRMDDPTGLTEVLRVVDVHASDDDGATWTLLASLPMPTAHRTWLAPDGATVHLGVMSYGHTFHASSEDGGVTWSLPNRVYDYNTYNGRLVARGGTLVWPWLTGVYEQAPDAPAADGWTLDALRSADGGRTWARHPVATLEGRGSVFVGATTDAGGFHLAWSSYTGEGSSLLLASSPDGATWGDPYVVAAGPGLRVLPWIDAVADGTVGVAWYQNDEASGDPLNATGPWRAHYVQVRDVLGSPTVAGAYNHPEPILEGPLCLQAFSCGDALRSGRPCFHPVPPLRCSDLDHVRYYDDYLGLDHDKYGRAYLGVVATHGFGLPEWTPGEPAHPVVIRHP